uniref:Gfo/Idh/MocA-like oxidoreductase N-terminal domain-containing protein n=1 Tax=Pinguiococcus pyrenoidosus TaxID=172671 RepID=A0A7R9UA30_9STRA|mmetsp:Transcript_2917/g.11820  ORF Transcript_2917/g.11820 Transcript_2917/m.11820 type:complete len:405 (+) Transcript_2917:185-1399(+)
MWFDDTLRGPANNTALPLLPGDEASSMAWAPEEAKLRWGIMGCANIARKNARSMLLCPSAELVAVASRQLKKAQTWAAQFCPEGVRTYGSYDELLQDPEVDAVYMPLPTKFHVEWVPKAARAKKHVLVEKPVALSLQEMDEMIAACEENGVFLMDGVMFMHHQRLRKITADIWGPGAAFGQNLFGVPTLITSGFSFKADDTFLEGGNIRTQADSDPLGALGDLGWYCIRFGLACHQYRWPQKAKSVRMIYNAQGVPIDSVAHIMWDSGDEDRPYVLQFQCSFMHPFRQWMEVCGSTKILKVEDFVISRPDNATYTTEMTGFLDYDIRPTTHTEHTETPRWPQEVRMFDTFAREVAALGDAGGKPSFWSYVTAATQACCDAVVTSSKNGGEAVDVPTLSRFSAST